MTDDELNKFFKKQQQQQTLIDVDSVADESSKKVTETETSSINVEQEVASKPNFDNGHSSGLSQSSNTINLDFSLGMSGFYQTSNLWENPQLDELYGTAHQPHKQADYPSARLIEPADNEPDAFVEQAKADINQVSDNVTAHLIDNTANNKTEQTENSIVESNIVKSNIVESSTVSNLADTKMLVTGSTDCAITTAPVELAKKTPSPISSDNPQPSQAQQATTQKKRVSNNPLYNTQSAIKTQQTKKLTYPDLNKVDVPCELNANAELQLAVSNVEQYIDTLQMLANQITIHYHEMSSETAKMMTLTKNLQDVTLDNVSPSFEKMLLLRRRLVNSYKYITGFSSMVSEIGDQWQTDVNVNSAHNVEVE